MKLLDILSEVLRSDFDTEEEYQKWKKEHDLTKAMDRVKEPAKHQAKLQKEKPAKATGKSSFDVTADHQRAQRELLKKSKKK